MIMGIEAIEVRTLTQEEIDVIEALIKEERIRRKEELAMEFTNALERVIALRGQVGTSFAETMRQLKEINQRVSGKIKEPKYRCPETGLTWSGSGRKPGWVKELIAQGKLDECLIQKDV